MHTYEILEEGQDLQNAKKALILLHGRGGTAEDIMELAHYFTDDTFYIAAPQATNNQWYPNTFLSPEEQNQPWLNSAIHLVKSLIDEIAKTIPKDKIFIMGFSQGACLTLEVTATYAEKYGGAIAFTGGLIGKEVHINKYAGNFKKTKIYIGSSKKDPYIPLTRIQESEKILKKLGAEVTLDIYEGSSHTITNKEIAKVRELFFS